MSADPSLFFNSQNSFFPALTNSKFLYLKEKRKIEKKIAYVTTIILHFSVCVIHMCVCIYILYIVYMYEEGYTYLCIYAMHEIHMLLSVYVF